MKLFTNYAFRLFAVCMFLLISSGLMAQTTYYSKAAATDFNSVSSWGTATNGTGTAPAAVSNADNFIVANSSVMTLSANAAVKNLTITLGTLTVGANTLTVSSATGNNSTLLVNGGTLTMGVGSNIVLNGKFYESSGQFNQSGGAMVIDGNDNNNAATSATFTLANEAMFWCATNGLNCTAGTITIVDPPVNSIATNATNIGSAVAIGSSGQTLFTGTHTFIIGDGVSTTPGNADGFIMENYYSGHSPLQNVIINGGAGTNRHATGSNRNSTAYGFECKGNLTINAGSEMRNATGTAGTGSVFFVGGNITNNGTLTISGTSPLSLGISTGVTAPYVTSANTISGTGVFRNSIVTSTANFANLTLNNPLGINFANTNSLLSGTNVGTVSGTLTITAAALGIDLNGGTFVLGVNTPSITAGTLSWTAGGFKNGSFKKYLATATMGTTINTSGGLWPFVVAGTNRNFQIAASTAPSAAGSITVSHADVAGLATVALSDGGNAVDRQSNASWTVTTADGLAGGTYLATANNEGMFTLAAAPGTYPRLIQGAIFVGAHGAATGTANAAVTNRTGITSTDFLGTKTYSSGITAATVGFYSVQTGDWNVGSTWNTGTVPTATNDVVIQPGHIVTVNSAANIAKTLLMNGNAVLNVTSGDLSIAAPATTAVVLTEGLYATINVNGGVLNIGTSAATTNFAGFVANGTLNVSSGTLNVYGYASLPSTAVFAQTGGAINVDGNKGGVAANSVAVAVPHLSIATSLVTLTGGTMTIVDPHAATTGTTNYSFSYTGTASINNTVGWSFIAGSSASSDAGGFATYGLFLNNAGGKIYFNQCLVDAGVSGTNRFVVINGSTFGFKDLTISGSGELRTSSGIFISRDLVNNGILTNLAGAVTFSDFQSGLGTASTLAQTVSGGGTFRNLATAPTASFTTMTIQNTNTAGVTFLGSTWNATGTGTVSGTLTFTAGRINTSGGTFTLGTTGLLPGTLSYTAGGFTSGSVFRRWITTTAVTMPSVIGQYPFVANNATSTYSGDTRSAWFAGTLTTAGWVQAQYNEVAGNTAVSITDGAISIATRSNSNWVTSTGGSAATVTGQLRFRGDNLLSVANVSSVRIVGASAVAAGTSVNGSGSPVAPEANKQVMTAANLAGTFYFGNSDVVTSVASGNWEDGSTWSSTVAPLCTQEVVIAAGHNVTVSAVTAEAKNLQINATATLTISGSTLNIGCTGNNNVLNNNGTINMTAGSVNINGNLNNASTSTFTQAGGTITINGNGTTTVARTGTISNTAASATVTGVGTSFLTDLAVGQILTNGSGTVLGTITAIASATSLTVSPTITLANTAITYATQASVSSLTPLCHFQSANTNLNGGTIIITNPHAGSATTDDAFRYTNGTSIVANPAHTLQLGNGSSTQVGGNATNGFGVECYSGLGRLILGNVVVNTTSTGATGNRFVANRTGGTLQIGGNLTITSGRYYANTAVAVAGNILNNGEMVTTNTLIFGAGSGTTTIANTVAQTVDGTGTFANSLTASTANFANMTINSTHTTGVTFLNANVLKSGSNVSTVSSTLTFTSGFISTGTNEFILGNTVAGVNSAGILTYTTGGFTNGSTLARLYPITSGSGSAFTPPAVPSVSGAGTFPFATLKTASPFAINSKSFYVNNTTAATTTGGKISVKFNETAGTSTVAITDGTYNMDTQANDNWAVTATGFGGTPVYSVAIAGQGDYVPQNGNSRITLAAAMPASGTHATGTALPIAMRTGLALADLTNTFRLSISAADIPNFAILSGNWGDVATWSKGTVPTACEAVVINAGVAVNILQPAVCSNLTIANNASLTVNSRPLTIGCTGKNNSFVNNGTFTQNGSTVTLNGSFFNGNITVAPFNAFIQNGGNFIIDGNDGGLAATSAPGHLFDCYVNSATSLQLNAGTITIVDPAVASGFTSFKPYLNTGIQLAQNPAHTLILGNGTSTDATANTSGFLINVLGVASNYYYLSNVTVNGTPAAAANTTSNRHVTHSNLLPISGDLTINGVNGEFRQATTIYLKGNLAVGTGATLVTSTTFAFVDYTNSVYTLSTVPSIISGAGNIYNSVLPASSTANFVSLTVNNAGLSIARPLSISSSITTTAGVVTTSATNLLTLGTSSAVGSAFIGTGATTGFVSGPFARIYPANRTGAGAATSSTLFPVGNGTTYRPFWVDPTTTAGGATTFTAEAFAANAGAAGSGVSNLATTARWEVLPTSTANLTNVWFGAGEAGIAGKSLVAATSAAGSYESIIGTGFAQVAAVAPTPAYVRTSAGVLTANYNGYISYGDLTPCSAPSAPTTPSATQLGATSFTGSFTASTGSPAASGYLVVRYPAGSAVTAPVTGTIYALAGTLGLGTIAAVGTPTTFAQTGLTAATSYDYQIYAYHNSGCSGGPVYSTNVLLNVTTCSALGTPAVPTLLTSSNRTTTTLTFSWTASTFTGATYEVDVCTDAAYTVFLSGYNSYNNGTAVTLPLTGLTPATRYYVRVRAKDPVGGCYSTNLTGSNATTCASTPIPYAENFNGTGVSCASVINTSGAWSLGTAPSTPVGMTGTSLLYTGAAAVGNAWAYTQGVTLTAGTSYDINFKYATTSTTYTHALEVYANAAISTTGGTLLSSYAGITGATLVNGVGTFVAPTTDVYYFAFRATSAASQLNLYVDDITIDVTPPCSAANGGTATTTLGASLCGNASGVMKSTGYSRGLGIAYQWQSSTDNFATVVTDIAGATNPDAVTVTQANLTPGTNQFRLKVTCSVTSATGFSSVLTHSYSNPTIASTTPGSRCGTGTVTLGAAPTVSGDNVNWYAAASGGAPLGTGTSFTTPSISATTNYYASASSGGISFSVGLADNSATFGTFGSPGAAGYGFIFTTTSGMTLNSVNVYPQAAGTYTIQLQDNTGVLVPGQTIDVTFTAADINVKKLVALGFTIPSAGTYRLQNTVGTLGRFNPVSGITLPVSYGGGVLTLVSSGFGAGVTANTYYSFFDWTVTSGCEGTRTLVAATVNTPPPITATATSSTICNGLSTTLNVASGNAGYTYAWSNSAGTGASVTVSPTANTTYTVTATDASGGANNGCATTGTVGITVNPTPAAPVLTPATNPTVCSGSIQALSASAGSSGLLQVGTGTGVTSTSGITPYNSNWEGSRTQYLYTASELSALGFTAGNISSLQFNVTTVAAPTTVYNQIGFTIKMGMTTASAFAGAYLVPTTSFSTVYGPVSQGLPTAGWNPYPFAAPFAWDGVSNILIDICHDNDINASCAGCYSTSSTVEASTTTFNSTFGKYGDDVQACGVNSTSTSTLFTTRPNIKFNLAPTTAFTWSPLTELFSDAAATVAYTGAAATTVYAKPTATRQYTATASNPFSCTNFTALTVNVDPTTVAGTIAGGDVCLPTATNSTVLTLSGHVGSVVRWESAANAAFTGTVTSIPNTTTTLTVTNAAATIYYRAVVKSGQCNQLNTPSTEIKVGGCAITLSAKVLLAHANPTTGLMSDYLTVNITSAPTNFPLVDPYSVAPLNSRFVHKFNGSTTIPPSYGYATTTLAVLNGLTGNNKIVDWVFLELRTGTSGSTVVEYTRAALLQKDGDIVDASDGVSPVSFPTVPAGSYYVTVKHRNSLGFRTTATQSMSSTPIVLNLSDNSVALYGSTPTVQLGASTNYAMPAGELDGTGQIDGDDILLVLPAGGNYDDYPTILSDFNYDGQVDGDDILIFLLYGGLYEDLD
jgi:hypothetical protein